MIRAVSGGGIARFVPTGFREITLEECFFNASAMQKEREIYVGNEGGKSSGTPNTLPLNEINEIKLWTLKR